MPNSLLGVVRGSGNPVAEIAGWIVLSAVIFMLLLSVWRQLSLLGPYGQIADSFGILPQWKFFALSTIETREDSFDDFHLLARLANDTGEAGLWQSLLWNDERKYFHILWNPYLRAQCEIQLQMLKIVRCGDAAQAEAYQTSLPYLTLLRYCLDSLSLREGQTVQFAIVSTRGNISRPVSVKFLSALHVA